MKSPNKIIESRINETVSMSAEEWAVSILTDLKRGGYFVVPIEPTDEMLKAGSVCLSNSQDQLMEAYLNPNPHALARVKQRIRYKAMISAAPDQS